MKTFFTVMFLSSFCFSLTSYAVPVSGSCTLTEVDPIMVPNDDDYGSHQDGSIPIRRVTVNATLVPIKVGYNAPYIQYKVATRCSSEINRGFNAEGLSYAVIPDHSYLVNPKVSVVIDRPDYLEINLQVEAPEVNALELKQLFKKARIISKNRVEIDSIPGMEYLNLNLCVGVDRPLSRTPKMLVCEYLRGTSSIIQLNSIDLSTSTKRPWVYFFNYWVRGKSGSNYQIKNW